MVSIVAIEDQRLTIGSYRQQSESISEPPTARTLAHVPANCGQVSDLRTCSISGSMSQHGIALLDRRIVGDLGQRRERAQAQSALLAKADSMQLWDPFYVHQTLGMNDVIFHQAEQVAAAGENLSIAPLLTQQTDHLLFLFGICIFEGSHARAPSALSSASRTRSGVKGRFGTRTPMALAT